ncbi:hypothetical protein UFOVP28_23 [uncultured Caudovirales phage]|uniref:Uncharacterized protein n=1 Tax=uncultured Caudovirales phage TaxID=2100421 RepID=A0A6J5KN54_9CAUD|nr:hypothetical protein UFOVP28_23 [uncultured Caudovirales phage]
MPYPLPPTRPMREVSFPYLDGLRPVEGVEG